VSRGCRGTNDLDCRRTLATANASLRVWVKLDSVCGTRSSVRRGDLLTNDYFTKIRSLSTGGCLDPVRRSSARALVLVNASPLKIHPAIVRAMRESTRKHLNATSDASPHRGDTTLVDPKSS